MANKQTSGYGFGESNIANKEIKNSPIQDAEQKTIDLINKNPNGTSITKFSEGINKQLTEYLPIVKQEIAEYEKIKAKGSETEGYSEAIDGINKAEKKLIGLNNDFEGAAVKRKQLLDTQVGGTYAASNTNEQTSNFHNFANGTFSEMARIIEDSAGMPRLMYGAMPYDEVDVGGNYSFDLEDLIDEVMSETLELAHGPSAISIDNYYDVVRPNLEKKIKKLIRGEDGKSAVKDYMYQNPELIDAFISNQTGKKITDDFKKSEEYDLFYNLNKEDGDFNEGFVETVLGIHDAEFQKRESEMPNKEVEKTQSQLADELIKKYRK
tara:strand:- start:4346 stop:5314 length:969 start_codon:yes stop_codon:yes gene_type:complete